MVDLVNKIFGQSIVILVLVICLAKHNMGGSNLIPMSKGQGGNPSRCLDILVNPEVDGGGLGDENLETFSIGALKKSTSKMFKAGNSGNNPSFSDAVMYIYIYIYIP